MWFLLDRIDDLIWQVFPEAVENNVILFRQKTKILFARWTHRSSTFLVYVALKSPAAWMNQTYTIRDELSFILALVKNNGRPIMKFINNPLAIIFLKQYPVWLEVNQYHLWGWIWVLLLCADAEPSRSPDEINNALTCVPHLLHSCKLLDFTQVVLWSQFRFFLTGSSYYCVYRLDWGSIRILNEIQLLLYIKII